MTILLGYGRKSKADSANVPGLERQHANVGKIAEVQGCELEWHQDADLSGFYEDNRPEWQKLLTRLDDPDVIGVATESLDRIYRNAGDFSQFKSRIEEAGKRLIIADLQGVDGSSAIGNFILNLQANLGELEYRINSERHKKQLHHIKYDKRRHIGTIPFGCDRHPVTKNLIPTTRFYYYHPDTDEAQAAGIEDLTGQTPNPPPGFETRYYHDALTAAYDLYAPGQMSFYDVAQALNAAGWRFWDRKRIKPQLFNRLTVDSILTRHTVYGGELEPGLMGAHDPILPAELCRAVGDTKRARTQVRGPGHSNQSEHTYLLTGLLYCGQCGKKMCGQRHRQRPAQYFYRHMYLKSGCPEKDVPAVKLEQQVIETVTEIAQGPLAEEIAAEIRLVLTQAASADDSGLLVELEEKQARLDRLVDAYEAGAISIEELKARRQPLDAEIADLKQKTAIQPLGKIADVEQVVEQAMEKIAGLSEAEPEHQKDIIRSMFDRFEIEQGSITRIVPKPWTKNFFQLCGLIGRLARC